MHEVTEILERIQRGDSQAAEQLLPSVYNELRRLAGAKMANERADHTLDATALVHEAWIRLLGAHGEQLSWNSRGHFMCAAAEAMPPIPYAHLFGVTRATFAAVQALRSGEKVSISGG